MTPMFEQYLDLKSHHPDALLFFRMGDFYEMFFEDAEVGAQALELTLTARNKGKENSVPMCGVPHHAAVGYIQRLTDQGFKVAIAEQVEDPATAKGLVRREIVQVVTPGLVLDSGAIDSKKTNYLMAVSKGPEGYGVAFIDASTKDARATMLLTIEEVAQEITRMEPREGLMQGDIAVHPSVKAALSRIAITLSDVDESAFSSATAEKHLGAIYKKLGEVQPPQLDGGTLIATALGALLSYLDQHAPEGGGEITRIDLYSTVDQMSVDETTRRNLEIFRTLVSGKRKGSLLGLLDRTGTAAGARLLKEWLSAPLMDLEQIGDRADAISGLFEEDHLRTDLCRSLKRVADIERISARVSQGSANGRDLLALCRSLLAVPDAISSISTLPQLSHWLPQDLIQDVAADLSCWLADDPPMTITEGGLIRAGASPELDEILAIAVDGIGIIANLEAKERADSDISSLKIRSNRVFGYYIEVTRANLHKVPEHYIRKQTLSNCERFITTELKELEERVLGADSRRKTLETSLFIDLRTRVLAQTERLLSLSRKLAALDVLSTLAEVARDLRWVRPQLDHSMTHEIVGGRHPVVEASLVDERFVPSDVKLSVGDRGLIVLTGPNMSGKSTIMRMVAVITILGQMGSFVPATEARLGVVDRVFTRVGASDDLAHGQSTFMVEMSETSTILHHATKASLVLLDEIGRGTSTYDGLSIAWAVAEHLVDQIGCRTIFATHYHELCELAEVRETVVNQSVAVKEWGERIIFLRTLVEGGASRSYGIQCARIAGLPKEVTQRAQGLLTEFEKHAPRNDASQLSLFGLFGAPNTTQQDLPSEAPDPVREMLAEVAPNELSPMDALQLIYKLKQVSDSEET